ncbi:MAG: Rrf2 family transcriptional regulator [Treponema sp.]|nr:Rrf2 family transcriptional regulator [Candidatus Treponema equifaecale]
MMKISSKGQYALLLMTDLAEEQNGNFLPLKTLAHKHNISLKYAEQILTKLSKSGAILGARGNNGGYRLIKKPEEYSVGDILRIMEGDLNPRGENLHPVTNTGNLDFWAGFSNAINTYVDSITLNTIVEKNKSAEPFMYII